MRIAVISTFDADNIKTWSGIPINIISKLRTEHEVDVIKISFKRTFFSYLRSIWFNKIRKKQYHSDYDPSLLKKNENWVNSQINENYDIILSFQFYLLPYRKGKTVLITDATYDNLSDYYFDTKEVSKFSLNGANKIYQKCIAGNYASVFSSDWARESAIVKYNGNPKKLFTIPLGANLAYIPTVSEVNKWVVDKSDSRICRFLFLGAFWERKGGIDALDIIKQLSILGLESKLLIVGCNPTIPDEFKDKVEVVGFLNKEINEENIRLDNLLKTSHALLLPSLAECAACVYAEANAYGLPAIGRDTGGVETIIKNGLNGLLLGKNETNLELAKRWKGIFSEKEKYKEMCFNSKSEYENRLNYQVFYHEFMKVVNN